MSNNLYNKIAFKVEDDNQGQYAQEYLMSQGFGWWNGNPKQIHSFTYLPTCIIINENDMTMATYSGGNIDQYIMIENEKGKNKFCTTVFNYSDVKSYKTILKYGHIAPSYQPKKMNREILDESKFYLFPEDLLLEKSSLTKLGVPKEVMQPIQKDFAISPDAQWERISFKKDAERIVRTGEKELILQIELDSIRVFVSYVISNNEKYFIDTYILEDTGWAGEYNKLPREEVSVTQLLHQINGKSLLYHLKSPFSLIRQPKRKLIKKEKGFAEFTEKFKKDFIENFDSILKRIVGTQYKDAKKEIQYKARQMEIENKMMLSGLDDPLEGPNSLTLLDQFITEFEEAYSDFFGERLDIQELSVHFSREKIMTSFMYYIYTGKLLNK